MADLGIASDNPGAGDPPGKELWAQVGGGLALQSHRQGQGDGVVLRLQHLQLVTAQSHNQTHSQYAFLIKTFKKTLHPHIPSYMLGLYLQF